MPDERPAASIYLTVLVAIAAAFTLYLGSELLVPIAFAVVLSLAFRPVVRILKRIHIPAPVGAGLIVLSLLTLVSVGGWLLSNPIKFWISQAPQKIEAAQRRLEQFSQPMQKMTDVVSRLQRRAEQRRPLSTRPTTTSFTTDTPLPTTQPTDQKVPSIEMQGPGVSSQIGSIFGLTRRVLTGIIEVVLLLYLMLATDNLFFRKLIKVIPRFTDKEKAAQGVDEIERVVLRYLLVLILINTGEGVVVGITLWIIGFPAPVLWGLATIAMECIPYLGATVMVGLLAITGAAANTGIWSILAPPLAYLVITTLQNSLVAPYAYGRELKLNPVAVLIGVLFWWFVWGVPGAFLAVPIVSIIKIIADRIESWRPLGEFLGD